MAQGLVSRTIVKEADAFLGHINEFVVMKQIPNNSGFVYEIHIPTEAQQEQAKGHNNLHQVLAPFAKNFRVLGIVNF